ncbi:hypothetical protein [Paenibacillus tundrae]
MRKIMSVILILLIFIVFFYNTNVYPKLYAWYASTQINYVEKRIKLNTANYQNIRDIKVSESSITGEGENNDPSIIIPLDDGPVTTINFDITVLQDDTVQVFYLDKDNSSFNEIHSLKTLVHNGDNVVTLKIPIEASLKPMISIRIDPVQTNQRFSIKNLYINK